MAILKDDRLRAHLLQNEKLQQHLIQCVDISRLARDIGCCNIVFRSKCHNDEKQFKNII